MTKRQAPPARGSNVLNVCVKPLGPHQWGRCCGLQKASNTISRGASKIRLLMISSGALSGSGFTVVAAIREINPRYRPKAKPNLDVRCAQECAYFFTAGVGGVGGGTSAGTVLSRLICALPT